MTDLMELVGRLESYRPTNEWGDPIHHVIIDMLDSEVERF